MKVKIIIIELVLLAAAGLGIILVRAGKKTETAVKSSGCKVGGCSGELCLEEKDNLASTCVYREDTECFKLTKCERQADGKCGWTETKQFKNCREKAD